MMRRLRCAAGALGLVLLASAVSGCVDLLRPSLAICDKCELSETSSTEDRLTARFFGVTTILVDDGRNRVLIDGFFSRPSVWRMLIANVAPDQARIAAALEKAGVTTLDAVLVGDSHHDHAMDSASVAIRTDADLLGSHSTANIARGQGLPGNRIKIIGDDESGDKKVWAFDGLGVTVFKSPHSPDPPFKGKVTAPLHTPAGISDYKGGKGFSFLIEHRDGRVLIHPSANYEHGMYKDRRAEVVFLSIGKLGWQSREWSECYWHEVVETTGVKLVIPVHWDDFSLSLDQPLKPVPFPLDRVGRAMERIRNFAARRDVRIAFMPLFKPVDLFAAAGDNQNEPLPPKPECKWLEIR